MSQAQLDRIEAMLLRLLRQTGPKRPADDDKVFRDLKPKYWQGPSFAGRKFSECSVDYLRAEARYASACAYMNRKEGNLEKAQYIEKDERRAALATAWADYKDAIGEDDEIPEEAAPSRSSAVEELPF